MGIVSKKYKTTVSDIPKTATFDTEYKPPPTVSRIKVVDVNAYKLGAYKNNVYMMIRRQPMIELHIDLLPFGEYTSHHGYAFYVYHCTLSE